MDEELIGNRHDELDHKDFTVLVNTDEERHQTFAPPERREEHAAREDALNVFP